MRRPVRAAKRSRSNTTSYAAPAMGLVLSQSPASPADRTAEVVKNWIPTDRGLRVRGGRQKVATVGSDPIVSLFSYNHPINAGLFAATAGEIFDVSALNPSTAPTASVAGQASGYYSTQQIGTVGGEFLYAVNGDDYPLLYDGTNWNPVTTVSVNELAYDGLTSDFAKGAVLTGGTSGATATILMVIPATATTGVLKLGTIAGGPFVDNEAITTGSGAAVANGASTSASTHAITGSGIETDTFSAVWLYASRLFFVEKNTLTAWYLPVDVVSGAANTISLAGVFQKGGALLFGASWSIDAGDGMDDRCVFVSTEGEVAIFAGSNPSDANAWALEGRYNIAKPLGVNGHMQAGGDLLIATVDGIIPLSMAMQKDPAALSLAAVTRPIEALWKKVTVAASQPIELVKWPERAAAVVVLPEETEMLWANINTGAWAVQENWPASCGTTHIGKGYIGQSDGSVFAIDETGYDEDEPYTAGLCLAFDDLGDPTSFKTAQLARLAYFASSEMTAKVSVATNYNTDFPSAPSAAGFTGSDAYTVWDVDNWDEKLWWDESVTDPTTAITTQWVSVSGGGTALALQVQVTSGQDAKPNFELIRLDLAWQTGGWGV